MQRVSGEGMQADYRQLAQAYGDDAGRMPDAITHRHSPQAANYLADETDALLKTLARRQKEPPQAPAVQDTIAAYGRMMKQFFGIEREKGRMPSVAASYRDVRVSTMPDEQYEKDVAAFFADAIEAYYGSEPAGEGER